MGSFQPLQVPFPMPTPTSNVHNKHKITKIISSACPLSIIHFHWITFRSLLSFSVSAPLFIDGWVVAYIHSLLYNTSFNCYSRTYSPCILRLCSIHRARHPCFTYGSFLPLSPLWIHLFLSPYQTFRLSVSSSDYLCLSTPFCLFSIVPSCSRLFTFRPVVTLTASSHAKSLFLHSSPINRSSESRKIRRATGLLPLPLHSIYPILRP